MALTAGIVTPISLGDLAVRFLNIEKDQRKHFFGALYVTRTSLFIVTIIFGAVGLLYFLMVFDQLLPGIHFNEVKFRYFLLIIFLVGLSALVLYFRSEYLAKILKWVGLNRFSDAFEHHNRQELGRILITAAFRYMVFSIQYLILFLSFGVELDWFTILMGISLVYLAKSALPFFSFFGGIGWREAVAVVIFSWCYVPADQVVAISLLLWIINVLLPTMIGGGLIINSGVSLKGVKE